MQSTGRESRGRNRTVAILAAGAALVVVCGVCGILALFAPPDDRSAQRQPTPTSVIAAVQLASTSAPVDAMSPTAIPQATDTPTLVPTSASTPTTEPTHTPIPSPTNTPTLPPTSTPIPTEIPPPVVVLTPTPVPTSPPSLQFAVTSPAGGTGVTSGLVTIAGTGTPNATVEHQVFLREGASATVDPSGRWQLQVEIPPGQHKLTFAQHGDDDRETSLTITAVEPTPTMAPAATPTPVVVVVEPKQTPRGSTSSGGNPKPGAQVWVVQEVVDGDTIRIRGNGKSDTVRLIGVDTPETKDADNGVQCFGPEATARTTKLLEGKQVRLATDPTQDMRDSNDRLLAYVWRTDKLFVNLDLVRGGYGKEYTSNKPYAYQAGFREAQRMAQAQDRGLWSPETCDGDTTQPERPEPTDTPVPTAEPEPTDTPVPPSDGDTDVSYVNCDEVRAAGKDPLYEGQPGYSSKLDRDGDGIACDT